MKVITYEQARNVISDGDIIFVNNGKSIWSKLTQLVTSSETFHCGIAFWIRDSRYKSRLMIVEANAKGRRIVSLSSYSAHDLDILGSTVDWEMHCDPVLDNTGAIPYSFIEYVWIGLREVFGIVRRKDDFGEVCSKMVAEYCKAAGYDLVTDVSPGKLKTELLRLGFDYKCRVIKNS